jgi:DNA polymerase-3 subunit delta'
MLKGNAHVARRLEGLVAAGRVAHAYIFVGPAGVGKREAALEFARQWICPARGCGTCDDCAALRKGIHSHRLEIQPTEGRVTVTIEQVQQLQHDLLLRPERSLPRVVILHPAEALSEPAMNSLLKILEEPPDGVTLILLTDNIAQLLPTVQSRCHVVRFYPAPDTQIRDHLRETTALTPADVDLITLLAAGSFGEADRLAKEIETTREFVRTLVSHIENADFSAIIDTQLKSKDVSETRARARLAFHILALAYRDALRGKTSPIGPVTGTPERCLNAIETLLEHESCIDRNTNVGLTVSDALLQVGA